MIIQLEDAKYKLTNMRADIDELASALRIDQLKKEIEEDEKVTSDPDFWNDAERSSMFSRRSNRKRTRCPSSRR